MSLSIKQLSQSQHGEELFNDDCISLMEKIPDNSIDLIFADPPYNLQINNELLRPNNSKVEGVKETGTNFPASMIMISLQKSG